MISRTERTIRLRLKVFRFSFLPSTDSEQARGIAGTVLVHKICGAAAERGHSLTEIVQLANQIASK